MADIADGNGRVTLALVVQKVDIVLTVQQEILSAIRSHDNRLSLLERCTDVQGTRIQHIERDAAELEKSVDSIKTQDKWGTIGTGIAATVAGIIAIFRP
jgi:hypothetical protein